MLNVVNENREKPIKAWNPVHLLIISLIFSFFVTTFYYALNYKRFGDNKKFRITLISMISLIIIIFSLIIIEPDLLPYKPIMQCLNYIIPTYFWFDQSKTYKDFLTQGGEKASVLFPLLISIIIAAIIVFLMFI